MIRERNMNVKEGKNANMGNPEAKTDGFPV